MISGGGDANLANNTASDPTVINVATGGGGTNTNSVVLAGWDTSGIAVHQFWAFAVRALH